MSRTNKPIGRFHVVTNTEIQNRFGHAEIAALAAKGGADCIQLRDKRLPAGELATLAQYVISVCRQAGLTLIINDSVEAAAVSGADGVHLGRSDTPISEARLILGPDKIIGGTAGSIEELIEVERDGADYAGFGHVFSTTSKIKTGPPIGLETLSAAVRAVDIPVIAIGGITAANVAGVLDAGVRGVAVIGAVCGADDPATAARDIYRIITRTRGE